MPPKRGRNNNKQPGAGEDDSQQNRSNSRTDQPKVERSEISNALFEQYYKTNIVPAEQWDQMVATMREQLPVSFRVSNISGPRQQILDVLNGECLGLPSTPTVFKSEDDGLEATLQKPEVLPWYRPQGNAFQIDLGRRELKRFPAVDRFRKFLILHNHVGNITRQEAVSMIPPLLLDVQPHHVVLDMCAAPGSKTSQLLEQLHTGLKPGEIPSGIVIANDANEERAYMLVHQLKRLGSPSFMVTTHEGQTFPSLFVPKGSSIASDAAGFRDGAEAPVQTTTPSESTSTPATTTTNNNKTFPHYFTTSHIPQVDEITGKPLATPLAPLLFDRILCDVPCGGDGTMRKTPTVWSNWSLGNSFALQPLQIIIAWRALQLLKVGGLMVYSTCSISPIEDEAVVNELIRRSHGTLELVSIPTILPELKCLPGQQQWADHVDIPKLSNTQPARLQPITCLKDILDLPPTVQRRVRPSNFSPALLEKLYPEAEQYANECVEKWAAHVTSMKSKFASLEDAVANERAERAQQQVEQEQKRQERELEMKAKVEAQGKVWVPRSAPSPSTGQTNSKSRKDTAVVPQFVRDLLRMKTLQGAADIHNTVRVLPHQQNTGGFFIALIRKVGQLPSYDESIKPQPPVYTMRYDLVQDVFDYDSTLHNATPVGKDQSEAALFKLQAERQRRAAAEISAAAAPSVAATGTDAEAVTAPGDSEAANASGDNDTDLIAAATKAAEALEGGSSNNRGGKNNSRNQPPQYTKDPFKVSPQKVMDCLKQVWGVNDNQLQLLTRHQAKQYLMSTSIQEIILCAQNFRLKVVHGGLKAFESDQFLGTLYNTDDVSSSLPQNFPPGSYYRACQDAAQYTLPLVTRQVLTVEKDDMVKMLSTKDSLSVNDLSPSLRDILINKANRDEPDMSKVIRAGSLLMSYTDPQTNSVIVVAALKRAYSISLLVDPVERDAYKYILGVHDVEAASEAADVNPGEPVQDGDDQQLVQLAQE